MTQFLEDGTEDTYAGDSSSESNYEDSEEE